MRALLSIVFLLVATNAHGVTLNDQPFAGCKQGQQNAVAKAVSNGRHYKTTLDTPEMTVVKVETEGTILSITCIRVTNQMILETKEKLEDWEK